MSLPFLFAILQTNLSASSRIGSPPYATLRVRSSVFLRADGPNLLALSGQPHASALGGRAAGGPHICLPHMAAFALGRIRDGRGAIFIRREGSFGPTYRGRCSTWQAGARRSQRSRRSFVHDLRDLLSVPQDGWSCTVTILAYGLLFLDRTLRMTIIVRTLGGMFEGNIDKCAGAVQ